MFKTIFAALAVVMTLSSVASAADTALGALEDYPDSIGHGSYLNSPVEAVVDGDTTTFAVSGKLAYSNTYGFGGTYWSLPHNGNWYHVVVEQDQSGEFTAVSHRG